MKIEKRKEKMENRIADMRVAEAAQFGSFFHFLSSDFRFPL
jgi:hypothetical protein